VYGHEWIVVDLDCRYFWKNLIIAEQNCGSGEVVTNVKLGDV
jgi:hypothetical protein